MANRACSGEIFLTFFHPDYTVGPGVSPDHALVNRLTSLVGFTTGRDLPQILQLI